MLDLNTIKPEEGARPTAKRVGRGIGSGLGKTCGRGHKGQKSRSGGYHKMGFEGGQMPIQRRLPKFGFTSRVSRTTEEVTLYELDKMKEKEVDLSTLKKHGIVKQKTTAVKVILSGEIKNAVMLKGIKVTKGARQAIESAGGKIED